jgi:hypothetical protein
MAWIYLLFTFFIYLLVMAQADIAGPILAGASIARPAQGSLPIVEGGYHCCPGAAVNRSTEEMY